MCVWILICVCFSRMKRLLRTMCCILTWSMNVLQVYRGCGASKLPYGSRQNGFQHQVITPIILKPTVSPFPHDFRGFPAWWIQTFEVGEIFKNPRDSYGLVIQRPLVAMETLDRLCGFKILIFAEVMIQQQNLGGLRMACGLVVVVNSGFATCICYLHVLVSIQYTCCVFLFTFMIWIYQNHACIYIYIDIYI